LSFPLTSLGDPLQTQPQPISMVLRWPPTVIDFSPPILQFALFLLCCVGFVVFSFVDFVFADKKVTF